MTLPGDIVLDPFAGVATTGVASLLAGRRFIGAELDSKYADIADKRLREAVEGTVRVREDKPVQPPSPRSKLAIRPDNFKNFDAL